MHKDKIWPLIGPCIEKCGRSPKTILTDLEKTTGEFFREREMMPKNCLQYMNGHPTSYHRSGLSDADAKLAIDYMTQTGSRIYVHCPFSINLSKDPRKDDKSIKALHADIKAVGKAGISAVCHIGRRPANSDVSVNSVCQTLSCLDFWGIPGTYPLLLENAAGDKGELGVGWDELHYLAQNTDPHVGFCIDTQHSLPGLKADFTTVEGVEEFFKTLDRAVGLPRVKLFHLNDSVWNPSNPKGKKDKHSPFLKDGHIWGSDDRRLVGLNHLLLRGGELGIHFITETIPTDPYLLYDFLRNKNSPAGL